MSFFWWIFGAALLIVWVITLVDLVRRWRTQRYAAAWVLIVVLLPFAGAALYWALREPSRGELQQQVDAQRELRERSPYDRSRSR